MAEILISVQLAGQPNSSHEPMTGLLQYHKVTKKNILNPYLKKHVIAHKHTDPLPKLAS